MHDALLYIGIALVGLGAAVAILRGEEGNRVEQLTDLDDPTYEPGRAEVPDGATQARHE
ncbi:hypothetical protein GCM10022254_09220 [Actinomadura meridiana]|uniref:Secreted protein n=1 Tax=Actinomadura meridiana TaxID=559626 RepID=A0ABP8BTP8_9ACTN